jgi:hypothetical protein
MSISSGTLKSFRKVDDLIKWLQENGEGLLLTDTIHVSVGESHVDRDGDKIMAIGPHYGEGYGCCIRMNQLKNGYNVEKTVTFY